MLCFEKEYFTAWVSLEEYADFLWKVTDGTLPSRLSKSVFYQVMGSLHSGFGFQLLFPPVLAGCL